MVEAEIGVEITPHCMAAWPTAHQIRALEIELVFFIPVRMVRKYSFPLAVLVQ